MPSQPRVLLLAVILLQGFQGLLAAPMDVPFRMGVTYLQARRALLADGWSPRPRQSTALCGDVVPDRRCSLFPELQACSHTGMGFCRYEWRSADGRELVLITIQGDPQGDPGVVHDWFAAP